MKDATSITTLFWIMGALLSVLTLVVGIFGNYIVGQLKELNSKIGSALENQSAQNQINKNTEKELEGLWSKSDDHAIKINALEKDFIKHQISSN